MIGNFSQPRWFSLFHFFGVATGIITLSLTCRTSATFCRFSLLSFARFALPRRKWSTAQAKRKILAKCRLCSRPILAVLELTVKTIKWWRGMGKAKTLYTGQNAWKNSRKPELKPKKTPENPTPYPFIYHFTKKVPLSTPCLELCILFDCCKSMHCFSFFFFFYIEINLKNSLYTDVVLFFFSFLPPDTGSQ